MTVFIAAILAFLRSRVHLWMSLASLNFFFLLRCVFMTKLPNANGFGEEDLFEFMVREISLHGSLASCAWTKHHGDRESVWETVLHFFAGRK